MNCNAKRRAEGVAPYTVFYSVVDAGGPDRPRIHLLEPYTHPNFVNFKKAFEHFSNVLAYFVGTGGWRELWVFDSHRDHRDIARKARSS